MPPKKLTLKKTTLTLKKNTTTDQTEDGEQSDNSTIESESTSRQTSRKISLTRSKQNATPQQMTDPDQISNLSQEKRQKIIELFAEVLDDNQELAVECERALYEKVYQQTNGSSLDHSDFRQLYESHSYNILENLDPESCVSNPNLKPKLLKKEITPQQLVNMSDRELYPEKHERQDEKRRKEIQHQEESQEVTSDLYRCGKCKKRRTTYYQMQTRSGDEPMTTFITCLECGNRWKE